MIIYDEEQIFVVGVINKTTIVINFSQMTGFSAPSDLEDHKK